MPQVQSGKQQFTMQDGAKSVKEDISRSANDFALPRQKDSDEVVTVKRKSLLQLINECGEDQQIEDKFYFSVKMGLLTFFQYLHSQTDFCLKEYLSKGCGDAIQKTLQNISVDKYLRELWFQFLLPPSYLKPTAVYLLGLTVTQFIKSKQKQVRETADLAPNKKSMSLRQSLSSKSTQLMSHLLTGSNKLSFKSLDLMSSLWLHKAYLFKLERGQTVASIWKYFSTSMGMTALKFHS